MNYEDKKVIGASFIMSMDYAKKRHGIEGVMNLRQEVKKSGLHEMDPEDIKLMRMYPLEYNIMFLKSYYNIFGEKSFERMSTHIPKNGEIINIVLKWADTPEMLLENINDYWRRLYNFGRLEGVVVSDNEGEIYGYDTFVDDIFCKYVTGYIEGLLEHITGKKAFVEHTTCAGKGDERCTWKIRW